MSDQATAIVPEILYQNDLGREPMAHVQLAQDHARVIALPIQRRTGAELLPSGETLTTIERLARYVMKSGQFTKRFTNEAQVIVTLLKGHDLGISFADALEHVYVVNGKPGVSGQLMLRLIYSRVRHKADESLVEFRECNAKKATVAMRRPGQAWVERSFTVEQAKDAGLLQTWKDKAGGGGREKVDNFVWKAYREEMLLWRAVAKCARIVFSDAIGGVYFYDELMSGPLNNPDAVVPGQAAPTSSKSEPKKRKPRAKKEPKNGLTKEQRDGLNNALHRATLHMDPIWSVEIPEADEARFRDTRKLVSENACQAVLEFIPDKINPQQAGLVQVYLEARAEKWTQVVQLVDENAQAAGTEDIDAARRELWNIAWKAEAGKLPDPASLAAAGDALMDKLIAGLTKNLERLKAGKQDGEAEQ